MKKEKTKLCLIPVYSIIPITVALVWNMLVYNGTKLITKNSFHYQMEFSFEKDIPFWTWTVLIYIGCYLFWIVNYIIGCRQEKEKALRFISAEFFAKTICLFFFLFLPTVIMRPEVTGTGFCDRFMQFVFKMDTPDNLFPSIHCLTSWFCFIVVRNNKSIPKWYRWFSLIFALLICVSTLTTKQHVFVDTFAGVFLAEFSYFFVNVMGFDKAFAKAMSRFGLFISKHIKIKREKEK